MKSLIFNITLAFIVLIANNVSAQDNLDPHEIRKQKSIEKWNKLMPKYAKAQYAGSMGLISVGVGRYYGKKEQWETDFMIGYIPKYTTNSAKLCLTLKENFYPWKIQLKNSDFYYEPLSSGFYINSVLNDEFWVYNPDKYPSSYYTFSTKIRFNIYIGQRITYEIPANKRRYAKSISAFYEISSNDLDIISAIGNSYIKPTDYLHLSLGIKIKR